MSRFLPSKSTMSSMFCQVVGTNRPSLLVGTENTRILFDCPEGVQRAFFQFKLRFGDLRHYFFTQINTDTLGGLAGALFTAGDSTIAGSADVSKVGFDIHGGSGIHDYVLSWRTFFNRNDFSAKVSQYSPIVTTNHIADGSYSMPAKQIGPLTVYPVSLYPSDQKIKSMSFSDFSSLARRILFPGERVIHAMSKLQFNLIFNPLQLESVIPEDMRRRFSHLPFLNLFMSGSQLSDESLRYLSPADSATSYFVVSPFEPGQILMANVQALGVPTGPLIGQLKRGQPVTFERKNPVSGLPETVVVRPEDVKSPDSPSMVVGVVSCPDMRFLESLTRSDSFAVIREATWRGHARPAFVGPNIPLAKCEIHEKIPLYHFGPRHVTSSEAYMRWMLSFGPGANHFLMDPWTELEKSRFQKIVEEIGSSSPTFINGTDNVIDISEDSLSKSELNKATPSPSDRTLKMERSEEILLRQLSTLDSSLAASLHAFLREESNSSVEGVLQSHPTASALGVLSNNRVKELLTLHLKEPSIAAATVQELMTLTSAAVFPDSHALSEQFIAPFTTALQHLIDQAERVGGSSQFQADVHRLLLSAAPASRAAVMALALADIVKEMHQNGDFNPLYESGILRSSRKQWNANASNNPAAERNLRRNTKGDTVMDAEVRAAAVKDARLLVPRLLIKLLLFTSARTALASESMPGTLPLPPAFYNDARSQLILEIHNHMERVMSEASKSILANKSAVSNASGNASVALKSDSDVVVAPEGTDSGLLKNEVDSKENSEEIGKCSENSIPPTPSSFDTLVNNEMYGLPSIDSITTEAQLKHYNDIRHALLLSAYQDLDSFLPTAGMQLSSPFTAPPGDATQTNNNTNAGQSVSSSNKQSTTGFSMSSFQGRGLVLLNKSTDSSNLSTSFGPLFPLSTYANPYNPQFLLNHKQSPDSFADVFVDAHPFLLRNSRTLGAPALPSLQFPLLSAHESDAEAKHALPPGVRRAAARVRFSASDLLKDIVSAANAVSAAEIIVCTHTLELSNVGNVGNEVTYKSEGLSPILTEMNAGAEKLWNRRVFGEAALSIVPNSPNAADEKIEESNEEEMEKSQILHALHESFDLHPDVLPHFSRFLITLSVLNRRSDAFIASELTRKMNNFDYSPASTTSNQAKIREGSFHERYILLPSKQSGLTTVQPEGLLVGHPISLVAGVIDRASGYETLASIFGFEFYKSFQRLEADLKEDAVSEVFCANLDDSGALISSSIHPVSTSHETSDKNIFVRFEKDPNAGSVVSLNGLMRNHPSNFLSVLNGHKTRENRENNNNQTWAIPSSISLFPHKFFLEEIVLCAISADTAVHSSFPVLEPTSLPLEDSRFSRLVTEKLLRRGELKYRGNPNTHLVDSIVDAAGGSTGDTEVQKVALTAVEVLKRSKCIDSSIGTSSNSASISTENSNDTESSPHASVAVGPLARMPLVDDVISLHTTSIPKILGTLNESVLTNLPEPDYSTSNVDNPAKSAAIRSASRSGAAWARSRSSSPSNSRSKIQESDSEAEKVGTNQSFKQVDERLKFLMNERLHEGATVLFTGTAASLPTTLRNVSGIYLSLPRSVNIQFDGSVDSNGKSNKRSSATCLEGRPWFYPAALGSGMLMDCGESTFSQLQQMLGIPQIPQFPLVCSRERPGILAAAITGFRSTPPSMPSTTGNDITDNNNNGRKINNESRNGNIFLSDIDALTVSSLQAIAETFSPSQLLGLARLAMLDLVWISHMHADHHLGLQRILLERARARALLQLAPRACLVVGPAELLLLLTEQTAIDESLVGAWAFMNAEVLLDNPAATFSSSTSTQPLSAAKPNQSTSMQKAIASRLYSTLNLQVLKGYMASGKFRSFNDEDQMLGLEDLVDAGVFDETSFPSVCAHTESVSISDYEEGKETENGASNGTPPLSSHPVKNTKLKRSRSQSPSHSQVPNNDQSDEENGAQKMKKSKKMRAVALKEALALAEPLPTKRNGKKSIPVNPGVNERRNQSSIVENNGVVVPPPSLDDIKHFHAEYIAARRDSLAELSRRDSVSPQFLDEVEEESVIDDDFGSVAGNDVELLMTDDEEEMNVGGADGLESVETTSAPAVESDAALAENIDDLEIDDISDFTDSDSDSDVTMTEKSGSKVRITIKPATSQSKPVDLFEKRKDLGEGLCEPSKPSASTTIKAKTKESVPKANSKGESVAVGTSPLMPLAVSPMTSHFVANSSKIYKTFARMGLLSAVAVPALHCKRSYSVRFAFSQPLLDAPRDGDLPEDFLRNAMKKKMEVEGSEDGKRPFIPFINPFAPISRASSNSRGSFTTGSTTTVASSINNPSTNNNDNSNNNELIAEDADNIMAPGLQVTKELAEALATSIHSLSSSPSRPMDRQNKLNEWKNVTSIIGSIRYDDSLYFLRGPRFHSWSIAYSGDTAPSTTFSSMLARGGHLSKQAATLCGWHRSAVLRGDLRAYQDACLRAGPVLARLLTNSDLQMRANLMKKLNSNPDSSNNSNIFGIQQLSKPYFSAFLDSPSSTTLLIHEASFDDSPQGCTNAVLRKHSTLGGALATSRSSLSQHLLVTHYSARFKYPSLLLNPITSRLSWSSLKRIAPGQVSIGGASLLGRYLQQGFNVAAAVDGLCVRSSNLRTLLHQSTLLSTVFLGEEAKTPKRLFDRIREDTSSVKAMAVSLHKAVSVNNSNINKNMKKNATADMSAKKDKVGPSSDTKNHDNNKVTLSETNEAVHSTSVESTLETVESMNNEGDITSTEEKSLADTSINAVSSTSPPSTTIASSSSQIEEKEAEMDSKISSKTEAKMKENKKDKRSRSQDSHSSTSSSSKPSKSPKIEPVSPPKYSKKTVILNDKNKDNNK